MQLKKRSQQNEKNGIRRKQDQRIENSVEWKYYSPEFRVVERFDVWRAIVLELQGLRLWLKEKNNRNWKSQPSLSLCRTRSTNWKGDTTTTTGMVLEIAISDADADADADSDSDSDSDFLHSSHMWFLNWIHVIGVIEN